MKAVQNSVFTIANAAQRAGLTVHQVRTYLDMELVRPCGATDGGFRLLDTNCIERLKLIKACRDAELNLAEIADFVRGLDDDDHARRAAAQQMLRARIRDKRRALTRCARALDQASARGCTTADSR
jgi:MerR family mercuric resistance operon transcriptional regulator